MFSINLNSILLALLVSVAWYFGTIELLWVFSDLGNNWYWYALAVLYTVIINELFGHLICSHNLFSVNTHSWTYRILVFLIIVDHAYGPLTNLVQNHQNHHIYPDQGNKDNLDFKRHWNTVCSLSPLMFLYQKETIYPGVKQYVEKQKKIHGDILNDDWTFFCEEFKIPLTLVYWSLLYLLFPLLLFKIVFMGRVIISVITFLTTLVGHTKITGYRNFDVKNNTSNHLFLHYIVGLGLFSSFLHNNHHSKCWLKTGTHSDKWYEIDVGSYVIKFLTRSLKKSSTSTPDKYLHD